MSQTKITYVTMAGDEAAHAAYEMGVRTAMGGLDQDHGLRIGGEAVEWRGERFEDRSPTDPSVVIGRFAHAGPEHVRRALDAAREAFPKWRDMPWQERVAALRLAADRISARAAELAGLMSLEVGKNRLEAMGDAEEGADLIRYYCDQVEAAAGFAQPLGALLPGEETRSVLRPFGVWGVIAPFNFPLALAAGMAGGALAAGNTVVLKPACEAALTGLRLAEILDEVLPPGVCNFVTGPGATTGRAFVESGFDGLVFTGSKQVGFSLMRSFWSDYPKPVIAEMGGKNPAIVTARADLDKAAAGVARSAFGYGGQKCSACSRAYVAAEVYDEFVERLVAFASTLTIGDPVGRGTFVGPLIREQAVRTWREALGEGRNHGRILLGSEPLPDGTPHGHFARPAIVDNLPFDHALWRDELFVPFLTVGKVASLDEALALANRTEYGLTAGVFSEDPDEVERFFDGIEAGVAYANRPTGATTGAWPGVQSFCGWKASGSTGKGGCGPWYVQQFLREQSRTVMR
jgi:1-pyrroline-5-carboxylate dehydrogenase